MAEECSTTEQKPMSASFFLVISSPFFWLLSQIFLSYNGEGARREGLYFVCCGFKPLHIVWTQQMLRGDSFAYECA